MYKVCPDGKGNWFLYLVGDGGFDLVATFADKADAEFAAQAFEIRDNGLQLASYDPVPKIRPVFAITEDD